MGGPELVAQGSVPLVPPMFDNDHDAPCLASFAVIEAIDLDGHGMIGRAVAVAVSPPIDPGDPPLGRRRIGLGRGADRLPGEHERAIADPVHPTRAYEAG